VAVDAYQLSLGSKNAQTGNLSQMILRAKQRIWAAKETSRLREMNETLRSIEALIEADLERSVAELRKQVDAGELGEIGFGEDQRALREDSEKKIHDLREAFRIASHGEVKERVSFSCFSLFPDCGGDGVLTVGFL
jgi:STIP1 family protein 1